MVEYGGNNRKMSKEKAKGMIKMEFNRCSRCGSFYIAEGDVCPKCSSKDGFEFRTLQTYVEENGLQNSLETISGETGITVKNLNRFLGYEEFKEYQKENKNFELWKKGG